MRSVMVHEFYDLIHIAARPEVVSSQLGSLMLNPHEADLSSTTYASVAELLFILSELYIYLSHDSAIHILPESFYSAEIFAASI